SSGSGLGAGAAPRHPCSGLPGRARRRWIRPRAVDGQGAAEHVAHAARAISDLDVVVVRPRIVRGEPGLDLSRVLVISRGEIDRERPIAVPGAPAVPSNPRAFCAPDLLRGGLDSTPAPDTTDRHG